MIKTHTILKHIVASAFMALALAACNQKPQAPEIAESRLFASPEAAIESFVASLRKSDTDTLARILGDQSSQLLSSGDATNDANDRQNFLAAYDAKHSLSSAGSQRILLIGTEDWPFPIPLSSQAGKWYFDTAEGLDELIYRRIGGNELGAIAASRGFVEAQKEYAAVGRDGDAAGIYAMKLISDEGLQNGLYWPVAEGETPSPIGPFIAAAAAEGYQAGTSNAYHGYRYRMLYRQGSQAAGGAKDYFVDGRLSAGFALIAWPADYGNSGIKSFVVNQDGTVFEKDLGETTEEAVVAIDSFDPDSSWKAVPESAP